jgi:galactoside O-acetyltransferase
MCGRNVVIDTGVYFSNPRDIKVGNNVWIDKFSVLIAGRVGTSAKIYQIPNNGFTGKVGEIYIGHDTHLGIATIIQGHGGVYINDYFTTSANCRVYSYSDDYRSTHFGTMKSEHPEGDKVSSTIYFGKNVWLGLNVSVISASIEDNVFVLPHSVVTKNIIGNSVAGGNPAVVLKERFR